MARSQEEYRDYQAIRSATDVVAAEGAVQAFLAKYPQSELRPVIFAMMMQKFQAIDDAERTLVYAEKLLALDAQNTVALVIAANVLSERTRDTDLDRDQRLKKAYAYAETAIKTADTSFVVDARVPAEQKEAAKQRLLTLAHASLGQVEMLRQNYPEAEKQLQAAVTLSKDFPDALTLYRLAIVQHFQKKFPEALANVTKAVDAAEKESNPNVLKLAQEEKATLEKAQ